MKVGATMLEEIIVGLCERQLQLAKVRAAVSKRGLIIPLLGGCLELKL